MVCNLKYFLIYFGLKSNPLPKNRTIIIGRRFEDDTQSEHPKYKYPNNYVKSSRYTIMNFFPKNLFEQFQRIANFYFLCIALVQLFIESSVPIAMNIFPLFFVIVCTMVKQGYEDVLRHLADRDVNNLPVQIIRDGSLLCVRAEEIEVGDIVQCVNNDTLPCDLVLLSSSDPAGLCHATTASLDGETNLKLFNSLCSSYSAMSPYSLNLPDLSQSYHDQKLLNPRQPSNLHQPPTWSIVCEQPSEDLYQFRGHLTSLLKPSEMQPIVASNLLLRGATIRNTEFIFGCAVYTGPDTKMALNSCAKLTKFSQVELRLNYFLAVFLVVLLSCGLLCTSLKYAMVVTIFTRSFYIIPEDTAPWKVVQTFFSFIVLFNYLIPISLYVTIELQKFFGSKFFGWDINMYDDVNDIAAKANTSDLNEELGQIEFLFSDKTGTLTENDMKFRQCSIDGVKLEDKEGRLVYVSGCNEVDILDPPKNVERFFEIISLCHTVRVEKIDGREEYQASSPDEKAFLEASRQYGIIFKGVNSSNESEIMFSRKDDYTRRYKTLNILEFDSDRKRMSIVVQNEDGSIDLHCKGAETAMISQAASNVDNNNRNLDNIMEHVTDYAVDGLRTLVFGTRRLSHDQYRELNSLYITSKSALTNREELLRRTYDSFENELILLGCTGIEDKLQEQVKDTIEDLRDAGIQVWILTGDKEETAVNISHSTGHFSSSISEVRLTKQVDEKNCLRTIESHIESISINKKEHTNSQIGLIIDGQSLSLALKPTMIEKLRVLCLQCVAVLCCRMTPLQKSEVVSLIKMSRTPAPVTAAIGDGANDVSMIQEAHIGIGLFGKEGRQAVRAADFAIARFRYLRSALLVHGHYFYIRIATLVQYFFYKNTAFIGPQMYFTFFSGFSAQTVYDSLYLVLYNITLTSLPIFVYGLLEQHISSPVLLQNPKLYRDIRNNTGLSWRNFLRWNLFGLWHSFVAMFGPYMIVTNNDIISSNGRSLGFFYFGTLVLLIVWITTSVKLCLVTYYWNMATLVGFLVTVAGNLGVLLIYQGIMWSSNFGNIYWTWFETLAQPTTWLCIFIFVLISLTPDIIFKSLQDRQMWRKRTFKEKQNSVHSVVFENRHHNGNSSGKESHANFENGGFEDDSWQCSIKKSSTNPDILYSKDNLTCVSY